MLPEALLKRLAKRGIVQGDGAPAATTQQQQDHQQPPPSRQQQHSDSSSESEDDDDDDESDLEDRRDAEHNNEEIIAEDYDEYDQVNPEAFEYPVQKKKANAALDWSEKMKQKMVKRYGFQSVDGCQNKYNIHHHCSMYCVQRYGEVEFEIEKEYEKRAKRLLERYPLPRHWRKEYDIGCKAFYFYNKETRIVSWLPPTHPDAKMTKSAKVLRKELMEKTKNQESANDGPQAIIVESYPPIPKLSTLPSREPMVGPVGESLKPPVVNPPKRPHAKQFSRDDDKRPRMPGGGRLDRDRERERDRDRDRERERDRDRDRDRRDRRDDRRDDRRERDRERDRDRSGRGPKSNSGALDPMDPAAYSDIPRGTWASGLEAAAGATKKEKEKDKKEEKRKGPPPREEDSEDEHEVLKVSAINEFTQEDEKDE